VAYSLKIMLDTWLKLSTEQGSKLPDEYKQYVLAGTVLPLDSFEPVGADHVRLALGQDSQGRQVFFKGRNTWFAYRPTIQVLRDGQAVVITNPDRPPVCVLKVLIDTWLKLSTSQSSSLPNDQKQFMDAGKVIPISSYNLVKEDHLKVTLGIDGAGQQITFKGRNTWHVYRPMVQIIRDGQVVPFVAPSPDGTGKINSKGLLMLKSFEGLRLEAYQDAVGVWTIGYGTTTGVVPGMRISAAEAEAFLKQDLARFEKAIATHVKVPLNSDQCSALICFTYNVGESAFAGSTLIQLLNKKDYAGAAEQFLRWNKAGEQELVGLTRRRKAERALFLGQDFSAFM
jgi:GH24 family phage-related lysozyme (muramidase)